MMPQIDLISVSNGGLNEIQEFSQGASYAT